MIDTNLKFDSILSWVQHSPNHAEAYLGDKVKGDFVRFTLMYLPTCYRRGPYRLLIEVCGGPNHHNWGCFDFQDQPTRYYHNQDCALLEADSLARVLLNDKREQS